MTQTQTQFEPHALSPMLQKHPDFFRVLLENSRNFIFVMGREFRIVYANQSFLNLYHPEKRDRILGRTIAENFTEQESRLFFTEDRQVFETGFSETVEELADYTGRLMTIKIQKIRYYDSNGTPYILGVCTDIGRRTTHDLWSPLSAMKLCIENITHEHETKISTKGKSFLELMNNNAY